ncbi:hypothetical protein ILUMI_11848 [Ignelater luminosus]|uniref:ABC transporter domain-containing protein n=1 Tax=Ignelater luminosus TaxID=2038154 RepID=A0A8K0D464_IGNLU|nr:hypothetical protein ILUMI_11848 [Ignelater luminosus]
MSTIDNSSSVNMEFQDLRYLINGKKSILKSINGKFCSGELTAILGTSGAGKTTLLNILAGYISTGVTGSITTNGMPRNMKSFRKLSAYIMQEDLLQPYLSVGELMMIAANLKLGTHICLSETSTRVSAHNTKRTYIGRAGTAFPGQRRALIANPDADNSGNSVIDIRNRLGQKNTVTTTGHHAKLLIQGIKEVLKLLGFETCLETRTENLSGGQKKRLSIALEMVSDPSVIFLDEPTRRAGTAFPGQRRALIANPDADNSGNSVIDIRNRLGQKNTVTTTGHHAKLLIQGIKEVLKLLGFETCLETRTENLSGGQKKRLSIALEMVSDPSTMQGSVLALVEGIQNGKVNRRDLRTERNLSTSCIPSVSDEETIQVNVPEMDVNSATLFWTQFRILSFRMFLQVKRNKTALWILLTSHIIAMTLFGSLYYGVGYGNQIHPIVKVILQSSYLRVGIIAICNTLLEDRGSLDCIDEIYCYYQDPNRFLKDLGVQNRYYSLHILGLVAFGVVFRLSGFLVLKWRLTYEFSQTIVNYANKIFRHS